MLGTGDTLNFGLKMPIRNLYPSMHRKDVHLGVEIIAKN